MSSYRVLVYAGGEVRSQGTGWLVAADRVVTAFHVVGSESARGWWHEGLDGVRYVLVDGDAERVLEPLRFDAYADVAVLKLAAGSESGSGEALVSAEVLALAPAAQVEARWEGLGFPGFHEGDRYTLTGEVSALHGNHASDAMQLLIDQGTQVDWSGVSGTPVRDRRSGEVLGVITQITDNTATGWAATVGALRRLLHGPESAAKSRAPHAGLVREVLQRLGKADGAGVALLAPLGFRARHVVDAVAAELGRDDRGLVAVRLVPDRGSTREERLYQKLLRDLRGGVARAAGDALDAARPLQGAGYEHAQEAFEDTVEALIEALGSRKLLLLVEELARVPMDQRVRWGHLMSRLCDRGLRLLVWGGLELHRLCTDVQHSDGLASAFHRLMPVRMTGLDASEVAALLAARMGEPGRRIAGLVHELTGGHPGLVHELADLGGEVLGRADRDGLMALVLDTAHMKRLWRYLMGHSEVAEALRRLHRHGQEPMPRDRFDAAEEALEWLGIVARAQGGGWRWAAPAMQQLAESMQ